MRVRRPLAAVGALLACGLSLAHAADGTGSGAGTPPRRLIDERPFGGPPPQQHRSLGGKPWSTSCKTPSIACTVAKAQEVGSACACPGSDGKDAAGVIEDTEPK